MTFKLKVRPEYALKEAAPDLLEALEAFVELSEAIKLFVWEPSLAEIFTARLAKAKAAISKAKGE